jgi:hypothetical protein
VLFKNSTEMEIRKNSEIKKKTYLFKHYQDFTKKYYKKGTGNINTVLQCKPGVSGCKKVKNFAL